MRFKRFLSAFLCAAMLCTTFAGALGETTGMAVLPQSLTEIRAEAFADVGDIDKVIVPEGTETIGSRAFAGSSLSQIQLPSTLTYIADDAFEGCDDLTVIVPWGSYAHRWASFRDVECVVTDAGSDGSGSEESVFAVESLSISTETSATGVAVDFVNAAVTATDACALEVKVIVDGAVDRVLSENVEAGAASLGVKIPVETAMPAYYILEAALVDAQGSVLSNVLTDISHSLVYEEAGNVSRDEFDPELVMDFGETGYAVLEEDVVQVPGEAVDLGGGIYTFTMVSAYGTDAGSAPAVGDVLMLSVGGAPKPVKVGAIEILENGVIRVSADKSINLSDVYSKIDVNGYAQTDGGESEIGGGILFNYTQPFSEGNLSLTPDVSLSVNVVMKYDKKFLGEDYFEMAVETRAWGSAVGTISGAFSTEELEKPIELEMFKKHVFIPQLPVPAQVKVTLPLKVEADAMGTLEMQFDKTVGFKWDSVSGYSRIDPPWANDADARIEADFLAETGPKLTFGIDLMGLVEAWVFGQVGVKLTGELLAQAHFGTPDIPDEDKTHACNLCVDMDARIFGSVGANVKYNITEEVKGDKSCELLRVESDKFLDLYYSLINEDESCHEGEKRFDTGECPNFKYKVDFATEDMHGKEITGLQVDVTDGATQSFYGYSPYSLYLYEGNYTAGAEFDIGYFEERFSVMSHADKVTLKERETVISGVVTDNATGSIISGVTVTLNMPGGETRTTTTDKEGAYKLSKLPGGEYSIVFAKDGYSNCVIDPMEYLPGTNNTVNAALNGKLPYITARLQYPFSGEYVTAVATAVGGGEVPREVSLIPGVEGDFGLETFYLKYSDDKEPYKFTRTEDDKLWLTMVLNAADMGDGTYTYAVVFYSDTNNTCAIYREDGDTLTKVFDFTYTGKTDSVYGADGVHDGFLDYNNVQPSDGPGGIRETYAYFEENSVGSYDLKLSVEEADYSEGYAQITGDVITYYRLTGDELVIVDQYVK